MPENQTDLEEFSAFYSLIKKVSFIFFCIQNILNYNYSSLQYKVAVSVTMKTLIKFYILKQEGRTGCTHILTHFLFYMQDKIY